MIKKVSVVIPTYNEEEDIKKCLDSLFKQTFKNLEIIIVDDGSRDKTLDIVKKFKKVKIFKQNHGGPGKARNLGAKKARGEILVFIDADMQFNKDYIKNLIRPILKDKEKKIIGTTHDYEIAINTDNKWSYLWGKVRVSKENAKDVKIFRAIRKDKFISLGGFDPKYGYADDQTFWFKYHIKPTVAKKTLCYHKNPKTLKATYKQATWIGASWKERYFIFRIPLVNYISGLILSLLLPLFIFIKCILTKLKREFTLVDLIKYYSVKFAGYSRGVFRAVYLNKVWK